MTCCLKIALHHSDEQLREARAQLLQLEGKVKDTEEEAQKANATRDELQHTVKQLEAELESLRYE